MDVPLCHPFGQEWTHPLEDLALLFGPCQWFPFEDDIAKCLDPLHRIRLRSPDVQDIDIILWIYAEDGVDGVVSALIGHGIV